MDIVLEVGPQMLIRTSILENKVNIGPYFCMYSSLVKSGSSVALGNILNVKSFEKNGSEFLASRVAMESAKSLRTFDCGVVASAIVDVWCLYSWSGRSVVVRERGLFCDSFRVLYSDATGA